MSVELYLAFVLASALLAVTPGPAMSLIVANSASYGARAGLWTVSGNSLGLAVLIAAACWGMNAIMAFVAQWFDWIRIAGAAYLIWMGVSRWRRRPGSEQDAVVLAKTGRSWFAQGLLVALSNPKVLLFLGAFFPQFVDPASAAGPQLVLLACTFLVVVILIDTAMAVSAGKARGWLSARRQWIADRVAGTLLIAGGAVLLAARRP